jgi:hypothetical protein
MGKSAMRRKRDQLVVIVRRAGETSACRVLDFRDSTSYSPLFKELAYRCLAADPDLAGTPWEATLELVENLGQHTQLRMEAWSLGSRPRLLASLNIPVNHLAWIGVALAEQLRLEDGYTVHVAATDRQHPVVKRWMSWEDDDVALEETTATMRLPGNFSTAPLGPRRPIGRPRHSFLKCVFTPRTYREFTEAATLETENERGWLAQVRVHLASGSCYVVIDNLVEPPVADRGRGFLRTEGHQFFDLYQRYERLGGYLHFHPRELDSVPLSPLPSGPDTTLAWNLDASAAPMIVMPIAMFGFRPQQAALDITACGFLAGKLVPIDLEVLCDDSTGSPP